MSKTTYAQLQVTDEDHSLIAEAIQKIEKEYGVAPAGFVNSDNFYFVRNPANPSQIVASFDLNSVNAIKVDIAEAKRVQEDWELEIPWWNRVAILRQWSKLVESRWPELVAAMILEVGKSRAEAKAEIWEAIELIRYYCDIYELANGGKVQLEPEEGALSNIIYARALGTGVLITPFNFPMALAAGTITCALLTGNTLVWKPAPECPLSAYLFYQSFGDNFSDKILAGRIFRFTVCYEKDFEKAITDNLNIDFVAFTGSKEVGFHLDVILNKSSDRKIPVIGELGGKNPCIVTPYFKFLEEAGKGIARSAFGFSGQKCSACSRVIIHEDVRQEVIEAICLAAGEIFVMGDPRHREVTLGPVISGNVDGSALRRYYEVNSEAMELGAFIHFYRPVQKIFGALSRNGYWAAPVIIDGLPSEHRFFKDELFLPILCVQTYSADIEEAVALANDVEYGLTAGLYTADEQEKDYFKKHIRAGCCYINRVGGATTGAWPGHQSFLGWKNSSLRGKFGVCGPRYWMNFIKEQTITEC
jgi:1-pyrroline-5-carboxylate dehydrogenase